MNTIFTLPVLMMFLLTVITLIIILRGLKFTLRRSAIDQGKQGEIFLMSVAVITGWLIFLGTLSLNGFFSDFSLMPPRPLFAIFIPLPIVLIIAFSKQGTQLLKAVPAQWLIYIQAFRIFVEIILWLAFLKNLLPLQMTFEGRNFDVLSGLLALPVGYFCFVSKKWPATIVLAYNILGILLLFNILIVALLSMPTTLRYFMNEPANTIVATFPFIYLPGVLVPIAYTMHIFSLRRLQLGVDN